MIPITLGRRPPAYRAPAIVGCCRAISIGATSSGRSSTWGCRPRRRAKVASGNAPWRQRDTKAGQPATRGDRQPRELKHSGIQGPFERGTVGLRGGSLVEVAESMELTPVDVRYVGEIERAVPPGPKGTLVDPGDALFFCEELNNNQDQPTEHNQGGHHKNNRVVLPPFQFLADVVHPIGISRKSCDWLLILNA
jgi:hypothetical protein